MHLAGFAALVEFVHDNGYSWLFTVGNVLALAITLFALWLSWRIYRAGTDDEEVGSTGRAHALRRPALALLVNGINLLLIVLEGSYVYFIGTGHG